MEGDIDILKQISMSAGEQIAKLKGTVADMSNPLRRNYFEEIIKRSSV